MLNGDYKRLQTEVEDLHTSEIAELTKCPFNARKEHVPHSI